MFQALGYEFDNEEFHAYVHGALPYDSLNPDPVLRNLLLSLPQRKIVSKPHTQLNPSSHIIYISQLDSFFFKSLLNHFFSYLQEII
ncbi:hypothetical protein IC575_022150 [Cucumis melo]